jgi:hypothetical protein
MLLMYVLGMAVLLWLVFDPPNTEYKVCEGGAWILGNHDACGFLTYRLLVQQISKGVREDKGFERREPWT